MLSFPDAHFDSAVVTLVFCSVRDPEHGPREIWRVLKPGGSLLILEHVRAQGKIAAWIQDALVPLTTRCMGNRHWNRDTRAIILETGFVATQQVPQRWTDQCLALPSPQTVPLWNVTSVRELLDPASASKRSGRGC
jgi:SAM-dependent methyltransferase